MKYIALFRSINVGGKNVVKMADLKKLLNDIGCQNVQSYIQSGNVIFDSNIEQTEITDKIQKSFATMFNFNSAVTLRTAEELSTIITDLPFYKEEIDAAIASNPEIEHLYVYLTEDILNHATIEQLKVDYTGKDKLCLGRREIYLLCYDSIRDSKLATSLSKLNIPLTARNWRTVIKLHEMIVTQSG